MQFKLFREQFFQSLWLSTCRLAGGLICMPTKPERYMAAGLNSAWEVQTFVGGLCDFGSNFHWKHLKTQDCGPPEGRGHRGARKEAGAHTRRRNMRNGSIWGLQWVFVNCANKRCSGEPFKISQQIEDIYEEGTQNYCYRQSNRSGGSHLMAEDFDKWSLDRSTVKSFPTNIIKIYSCLIVEHQCQDSSLHQEGSNMQTRRVQTKMILTFFSIRVKHLQFFGCMATLFGANLLNHV